jgi:hypothetical protein
MHELTSLELRAVSGGAIGMRPVQPVRNPLERLIVRLLEDIVLLERRLGGGGRPVAANPNPPKAAA